MESLNQLANNAFAKGDYSQAADAYQQCIRDTTTAKTTTSAPTATSAPATATKNYSNNVPLELYFGYGDSLALAGRLEHGFDVYAHISNQLGYSSVPLDKLHHISLALLKYVSLSDCNSGGLGGSNNRNNSSNMNRRSHHQQSSATIIHKNSAASASVITSLVGNGNCNSNSSSNGSCDNNNELIDPLCCAICKDILRCPVTAVCGHTFCGECCFDQTQCIICGKMFTSFKPDVLVLRLVEKWWTPEANERAIMYMQQNALDDALKSCNESLEKCPNNYQGLLLRSEVLCWLNHYQSSLADADNALKSRPSSSKAHLRRAFALTGLGSHEEALIAHCVSACLNHNGKSAISSALIQDVAKLIQRLLVPTTLLRSSANKSTAASSPYSVVSSGTRRRSKKQRFSIRAAAIASAAGLSVDHRSSDCDEENSSCGDDDDHHYQQCNSHLHHHHHHHHRRFSQQRRKRNAWRHFSNDVPAENVIPRENCRFRTLLDRIRQEIHKIKKNDGGTQLLKVNPALIDLSDFDCVLCYRTLWKPVVTPCGHTYCLVCLDRCLDYSSHCPLCKSSFGDDYSLNIVRNSLSRKYVTKFIEKAMQRFIPAAYRKRQIQEIEKEPFVPVFICTTAFPYVPCPLFVYESRYRLMIRRAIESGNRQFGIVQPTNKPGPQRYFDYGTMLNIRDCVLLSDGRTILSTVGGRRFRVIERNEKDGYDTAKVQYIYDDQVAKERLQSVSELHANVFFKAVLWYNSLPERTKEEILKSFGSMPALETQWDTIPDGPAWAWYIIALLPLSQLLKVNILASTSLEKRLLAINKTLEHVAAQKRRSAVCVPSCEGGLQTCQAIECCQRATASTSMDDDSNIVVVVDDDSLQPLT